MRSAEPRRGGAHGSPGGIAARPPHPVLVGARARARTHTLLLRPPREPGGGEGGGAMGGGGVGKAWGAAARRAREAVGACRCGGPAGVVRTSPPTPRPAPRGRQAGRPAGRLGGSPVAWPPGRPGCPPGRAPRDASYRSPPPPHPAAPTSLPSTHAHTPTPTPSARGAVTGRTDRRRSRRVRSPPPSPPPPTARAPTWLVPGGCCVPGCEARRVIPWLESNSPPSLLPLRALGRPPPSIPPLA